MGKETLLTVVGYSTALFCISVFLISTTHGSSSWETDIDDVLPRPLAWAPERGVHCKCDPCVTGPGCSESIENYAPHFGQRFQFVEVNDAVEGGRYPLQYNATAYPGGPGCPCRHFRYVISDVENVMEPNDNVDAFEIDSSTGVIYLTRTLENELFRLTVQVRNIRTDVTDETKLTVAVRHESYKPNPFYEVDQDGYRPEHMHHVVKRAVHATDVTFTQENLTNADAVAQIGSRVKYRMTIEFPSQTMDMLVEIFAPENATNLMIICDVNVVVGSNLNPEDWSVVYDAQVGDNITNPDHVTIDFGNVTNINPANTDSALNTITIEYEAVMINTSEPSGNYWYSFGAEYDDKCSIYIGSGEVAIQVDGDVAAQDNPTFNIVGPTSMPAGGSEIVTVDMYLPYPLNTYTLKIFTPLDSVAVASICYMEFVSYGANFQCGNDKTLITATSTHCPQDKGNYMGTLDFPSLLNKGSRDFPFTVTQPDNQITAKFGLHLYDDVTLTTADIALALEVGVDTIWIGNMSVGITAPPGAPYADPAFDSYTTSLTTPWTAPIGEPFSVQVKFSVPTNGDNPSPYELEVLGPFLSDKSLFKVCKLRLISVGANFPCLQADDFETVYSTREADGLYADRAVLNIGSITNLGISNDSLDDIIEAEFVLTPLEGHPDATPGLTHTATFGISVGGAASVNILSMPVLLGAASTKPDVTNATLPTFSFNTPDDMSNIPVGGNSVLQVAMTTQPDIMHPMWDAEFLMPSDDDDTFFHLCRVELISAGKNVPCLTPNWANANVQKFSQYNDGITDRVLFNQGDVCNIQNEPGNTLEDQAVYEMHFQVRDIPDVLDNSQHWMTAGLYYTPTALGVAQQSSLVRRGVAYYPTATIFQSFSKTTDTITPIPLNYYGKFQLLMKIPYGDRFDLKVKGYANLEGLDVCSVRVLRSGYNLPCMVHETTSWTRTYWPSGSIQSVTAAFGAIQNFGTDDLVPNLYEDSNTAVVEIVTYANPAIAAGTYDVNAEVFRRTDLGLATLSQVLGVTTTPDQTGIDQTINTPVTMALSMGEIGGDDAYPNITKGQTKRVQLTATIPKGTMYSLSFGFILPTASIGKLEIVDAAISYVGKSLPCVDQQTAPAFSSDVSPYTTGVNFTLGYVYSADDNTDTLSNTIVFDAYVRATPNNLFVFPDTLSVTGVSTTFTTTTVDSIALTTVDPDSFNDIVYDQAGVSNVSLVSIINASPTIMGIGQNVTISANLTIPQRSSSRLLVDLKTPDDGTSACLTVNHIRPQGPYGRNVHGADAEINMRNILYYPAQNSTLATDQPNYVYLDLGIVTNTDVSNILGTFVAGDDDILVEFDVQMADCSSSVNLAPFPLSLGQKVANYIFIYNHDTQVTRNCNELPDVAMEVWPALESTSSNVVFEGRVYHTNFSSAEAYNMSVLIALPEYLYLGTVTSNSNKTYTVATDESNLLDIQFTEFYFTDAFTFKAQFNINSSVILPDSFSGVNSRFDFAVISNYIDRCGTYNATEWWPDVTSGAGNIFYDVDAGVGDTCNDPLGLETYSIQDCQVTGSRGRDSTGDPSKGRKNGASGWKPWVRDGQLSRQRYFAVYFGNTTKVTQVGVQQDLGMPHLATEFEVSYSLDGNSWFSEETVSLGPSPATYELVQLTKKVETRYIRLRVTNDTSMGVKPEVGIKFELFGCHISSDVTPAQACNDVANAFPSMPTGFYTRSFVASGAQAYVCDRGLDSVDFEGNCFTTTDGAATWLALDPDVASLIGYELTGDVTFAYAEDMETILASYDAGLTWVGVSPEVLQESQALTTWSSAIQVEEDVTASLDRVSPHPDYIMGTWGATLYGMFYNNIKVTQWSSP